jgi:hypothetical protein
LDEELEVTNKIKNCIHNFFGSSQKHKQRKNELIPFREATRVVKPGSGRMVILTLEKGIMRKILDGNSYWITKDVFIVDNGGYKVAMYLLLRSEIPFGSGKSNSKTLNAN